MKKSKSIDKKKLLKNQMTYSQEWIIKDLFQGQPKISENLILIIFNQYNNFHPIAKFSIKHS